MLKNIKETLHIYLEGKKETKELWFVDGTLGFGGHALAALDLGFNVIGIETDEKTLNKAKIRLRAHPFEHSQKTGQYKLISGNFRDIDKIVADKIEKIDVVLLDLGVNSVQLMSLTRGFSFNNKNALLDMRLDKDSQSVTAADLVNTLREEQLMAMFRKVLDFAASRKLAGDIVRSRQIKEFEKVADLLKLIPEKRGKTHPATKALLALRMAVNSELENLEEVLPRAYTLLKKGGLLMVISFHSGEDKIVKTFFRTKEKNDKYPKLQIPSDKEIAKNSRSRSAKLRILVK